MSFVAFSPDGSIIASDGPASADDVSSDLTLWSFPDGRLIQNLPGRPLAVSKDFKYYATGGKVVEISSGKTLVSLGKQGSSDRADWTFTFSADSRFVAASSLHPGKKISIFDIENGKMLTSFGKNLAHSMAFSPDGRTLASGYWEVVTLWDAVSGKRLEVLRGFDRYINAMSFSPDGTLLATGNDLGKLQLWDLRSGAMLHSINLEGGDVSNPAFSSNGRLIAVGVYGTGTVWMIDVRSGKLVDSYKVSDLGCGSVAFSPDGRYLITPSTGGLIKWPYDRGGTIRIFEIASP